MTEKQAHTGPPSIRQAKKKEDHHLRAGRIRKKKLEMWGQESKKYNGEVW
jgi:hypothetical protein